jgi:hypothetical protein
MGDGGRGRGAYLEFDFEARKSTVFGLVVYRRVWWRLRHCGSQDGDCVVDSSGRFYVALDALQVYDGHKSARARWVVRHSKIKSRS